MGLELGKIKIKRFADGEIYVQLQESVRGCDVFLVQPTCPPANENLMELLIMIDACRRASAKNITAVIPYFGYARADRKVTQLCPINRFRHTVLLSFNTWPYYGMLDHIEFSSRFPVKLLFTLFLGRNHFICDRILFILVLHSKILHPCCSKQ